jgi:hypothetical protein
MTRGYFREKGIRFTDTDDSRDEAAARERFSDSTRWEFP